MESYVKSTGEWPGGDFSGEKEVVLARVGGIWLVSGPVEPEVADRMKTVLRRERVVAFACCEEEYWEKGLPRTWCSDEYFPDWKPAWLSVDACRPVGKPDEIPR